MGVKVDVGVGVTAGIASKSHIDAYTTVNPLPGPDIVNVVNGDGVVNVNKPLPIPKVLLQYGFDKS